MSVGSGRLVLVRNDASARAFTSNKTDTWPQSGKDGLIARACRKWPGVTLTFIYKWETIHLRMFS